MSPKVIDHGQLESKATTDKCKCGEYFSKNYYNGRLIEIKCSNNHDYTQLRRKL